jgi:hypothetical protein
MVRSGRHDVLGAVGFLVEVLGQVSIEGPGPRGADHNHLRMKMVRTLGNATADFAMIAEGAEPVSASGEPSRADSGRISRGDVHNLVMGLQIERRLFDHVGFDDVEHLDRTVKA